MSRRRISCKELGLLDCQGWLYKKKEKGAFIGNKWKKFWFVLKGSSLYWYSSQLAEKAEGFINLPDFSVDRATECKKKHAIKINHPQIKTFYFAAENMVQVINECLTFLSFYIYAPECYSESEHDDPEITETPPPPYTAQQQPSLASSLSSEASCSLSSLESTVKSQESSSSLVSKVIYPERQSWLDIVNSSPAMEEVDQPLTFSVQNHTGEQPQMNCSESVESQQIKSDTGSYDALLGEGTTCLTVPDLVGMKTLAKDWAKCCDNDEMERLYKSLEQASLSPIGDRRPSTKKELRKSFIKRSKNPCINEKLHKIRVLNSTLKCKEHDLAMINQLLEDPELTAEKYRKWRNTNNMLVQDIYQQQEVLYLPEEIRKEEEMNPPPFIGNSL
uniref:Interaction protein for cytohesin exchange factors 1 n=1 Tax=Crocodylus porosus TaxID=8502 RepID=A0A7M4FKM1_CROPO